MGCPVALNSAIVQCVSQSNTHTLSKQTTPGKYSSAGYLFSLFECDEGEREEEERIMNKGWCERRKTDLDFLPLQTIHATQFTQ